MERLAVESIRYVWTQVALGFVGAGAAAVAVYRWSLIGGPGPLADYVALALPCGLIAAVLAGVVARQCAKGRSTAVRILASAGAIVIATGFTGGVLAGWAGTDPHGRYNRAYGATGRCLDGSVYATSRATVASLPDIAERKPTPTEPGHPAVRDRMAVRPAGLPRTFELLFVHASSGDRPVPGNAQTEQTLRAHGCPW